MIFPSERRNAVIICEQTCEGCMKRGEGGFCPARQYMALVNGRTAVFEIYELKRGLSSRPHDQELSQIISWSLSLRVALNFGGAVVKGRKRYAVRCWRKCFTHSVEVSPNGIIAEY